MDKTLIFTVTPGRSGSNYLSLLLGAVPNLHAEHEPEPNFVHAMRRSQPNPTVGAAFLREHKSPAIAKVPAPIYAKTFHLTCKGFIKPMIRMRLRPGLILLRRPPREVAWSLLERNCMPGRTSLGFAYLLDPHAPFLLPWIACKTLSDYKLCFWYALEIERRNLRYAALAASLDLPVAEVINRQLNDWTHFSRVLSSLNLPATEDVRQRHARISAEHHNANPNRIAMPSESEIASAEGQIWMHVSNYEPLLRQHVQAYHAAPG